MQVNKKVKWSRFWPGVAQRVGRGISLLFHDRGTKGCEWSAAHPSRTLLPGKSRYPLYRRLGGAQGRSGRVENLVPIGIQSPDRPVSSESLNRLSYPGPLPVCSIYYRLNTPSRIFVGYLKESVIFHNNNFTITVKHKYNNYNSNTYGL